MRLRRRQSFKCAPILWQGFVNSSKPIILPKPVRRRFSLSANPGFPTWCEANGKDSASKCSLLWQRGQACMSALEPRHRKEGECVTIPELLRYSVFVRYDKKQDLIFSPEISS